jgi:hypothetical protein
MRLEGPVGQRPETQRSHAYEGSRSRHEGGGSVAVITMNRPRALNALNSGGETTSASSRVKTHGVLINPAFSLRGDPSALQVEQHVSFALRAADRHYALGLGRLAASANGSADAMDAVHAARVIGGRSCT